MCCWNHRNQNQDYAEVPDHSYEDRVDSTCCSSCCKRLWYLFYISCFFSGQYVKANITNSVLLISVAGFFFFIVQLLLYFLHVTTGVAVEIIRVGNISDNSVVNCTLPYVHWKFSTAITVGTLAAFFSYCFLTILILMPVNRLFQCLRERDCFRDTCDTLFCNACSDTHLQAFSDGALSPFNDEDESSKLNPSETKYFFVNYVLAYILFACSFSSSFYFLISVYDARFPYYNPHCWISGVNIAKIVLHFSTEFCAIQSCFIFSKVVYKVTNKLKTLARAMDRANLEESAIGGVNDDQINRLFRNGDGNRARFYWLQKMDKDFIEQVKPTLDLFGVWFLVHWVMYALTTVLLTAFVLENILYVAHNDIGLMYRLLPDGLEVPYIFYLSFFTLFHAYLFLYPCFRAASIAVARVKFIDTIFKKHWVRIPLGVETNFIQYLKTQDFAFRVPLFCASITFEFNWVYVALILAICGTYLNFGKQL